MTDQQRLDAITARWKAAQVGHVDPRHIGRIAAHSSATREFWSWAHSDVGWLLGALRKGQQ